ncbi:MAG: LytR C-terminal domain-containing protein [Pseudoclavibacter sp.]
MAEAYPHDEFDDVEPNGRLGAHRSPKRDRGWLRALIVLALVVALMVAGLSGLQLLGGGTSAGTQSSTASPSRSSARASASASVSSTPEATASASSEAASPSLVPFPSDPAAAKALEVRVVNAAAPTGSAAYVQSVLQNAGWNSTTIGNSPNSNYVNSFVYYTGPADRGSALQLAQALNIPAARVQSGQYGAPLVVVLGSSFSQ